MVEAVIFDMDGVIIDSEPLQMQALIEAIKASSGVELTPQALGWTTGRGNAEVWQRLRALYPIAWEQEKVRAYQLDALFKLMDTSPLAVPIEGILPLARALKAKGIPMAVASSSSLSIIDKVLDKLALREYFTLIATGDEVPASKPAPDIFLLAAQRLGCKIEGCWVIEDSYNGVTAAKAAGMHCIGFYNPHSGNQDISAADCRITHIGEAMGILGLEG